jgi:putative ATP-dependent endonuclease of OLD family
MFLSKIAIKNFRNLESLVVTLKGGLNVVVGENNAGKTNLLDALRVALGPTSSGDFVRVSEDDLFHDRSGKRAEEIRIDLEFSALSEDEQAEMIEILKYDPSKPAESKSSIHFEFVWSAKSKRFQIRRWGGEREDAETAIPEEVFQSLPVTLLNALRDATTALAPGRQSRLGRLLANSATEQDQTEITEIVRKANKALEANDLIKKVEGKISATLGGAVGPTLTQDPVIRSSDPQFERLVNNLRLVLRHSKIAEGLWGNIEELRLNGLGYNNLLYIATVVSELALEGDATLPLLLVEEPEAHLHPQLQTLLSDFLADGGKAAGGSAKVQTIITTHSPTIASHVDPAIIRVLHETSTGQKCVCLGECGLNRKESRQLSRMLDATRATLLFARGIIMVEGISEMLLLPVLARRLKHDLEQAGVSTIPVYGVDFATFGKLYGAGKLQSKVAIVTDGDPGTSDIQLQHGDRKFPVPKTDPDGNIVASTRTKTLRSKFEGNASISVYNSSVTFEYDLADAGPKNADVMCKAWENCFAGKPLKLNSDLMAGIGSNHRVRTLAVWDAICNDSAGASKGAFAQELAELLEERNPDETYVVGDFVVPPYIQSAIKHAVGA